MTHFKERILKIGVLFLGKTRDLANVFLTGFSYMGKRLYLMNAFLKGRSILVDRKNIEFQEHLTKGLSHMRKKQHLKT